MTVRIRLTREVGLEPPRLTRITLPMQRVSRSQTAYAVFETGARVGIGLSSLG